MPYPQIRWHKSSSTPKATGAYNRCVLSRPTPGNTYGTWFRIGSRGLHPPGCDVLFYLCNIHSAFIQLQHLPGSAPAQTAEQDVEMARQFFAGPMVSSTPSLVIASPGPHAELSRLPEVSARFDLDRAWARGIPQQQQPAFRDNAARGGPWASEFGGVLNQTIPGPSAQQQGQQISDGMYWY